jgi:hypothetical protein
VQVVVISDDRVKKEAPQWSPVQRDNPEFPVWAIGYTLEHLHPRRDRFLLPRVTFSPSTNLVTPQGLKTVSDGSKWIASTIYEPDLQQSMIHMAVEVRSDETETEVVRWNFNVLFYLSALNQDPYLAHWVRTTNGPSITFDLR